MKPLILLFLFFSLSNHSIGANDTVYVGDDFNEMVSPISLPMFTDGSFQLHPNFLLQIFDVRSGDLLSNKVVLGYVKAAYWHRVLIKNTGTRTQNLLISIDNPNLDVVEFYIRSGNQIHLVAKAGDHIAHKNWPIRGRLPVYELRIKPGEVDYLYTRSYNEASGNVMVPISIRTQNAYHQYQEGVNLVIGIYFGFILVNISLAFFSVIMLRRSIYLWYGFFLISMLGYSISTFGYGFQYMIPEYPGYNDILRSYLALLSSFFIIRFAQHFLSTKENLPILHGLFNVSTGIIGSFIFLSFFLMEYLRENFNSLFPWVSMVILFTYVALLVAAYSVRGNSRLTSNSFLIAFSFSLVGAICLILVDLEVINYHHFFYYAPWYGSALEILIFTAILAYQFKLLSDERLLLQAEVAKEKTARLKEFFHGQEKERERIARDLHDHVAGTLVGARFLLPSPHQLRNTFDLSQLNFYEKALGALDQSIYDVRNISHQLLPPSFKESSLQLELEKLVSTYRLLSPTSYFSLTYDVDEHKMAPDVAMTIYRITQESLQNIHKHAFASTVWMHICLIHETIQLRIEDNGRGFDTTKTKSGIGLHNFQSRISAYEGASFRLNSSPGKGTRIELDMPVHGRPSKPDDFDPYIEQFSNEKGANTRAS